jgi:hypothetical protein
MRAFVVMVIVLSMLAIPTSLVHADIAPPEQPPGSNPQPGAETTQVRMMSETVTLDILSMVPSGSLGQALVTANFTMRNLGSAAESMAVRFPLGVADERSGNARINDFKVKVDGKTAALREITGSDPYYDFGTVPWVEFDAAFPPEKDVVIQVSYTLEAGGETPFSMFSYVFSTGAGWNGTIGSAALVVRFPYEVSELNVLPSYRADEPNLVQDHKISPMELKWTWTDFAPERGDNFEITVGTPSLWRKTLVLEAQLAKNANDGESWGMLGKLYKSFAFDSRGKGFRFGNITGDAGAIELYARSLAAYEKAVTFKPLDAQWHAGFADLLIYHAYFAGFEGISNTAEMIRGLGELDTALKLAPDDAKVLEIAEQDAWYAGEGMAKEGDRYTFPWLTATPAPTATQIGAEIGTVTVEPPTPEATTTSQPKATSTPAVIPTQPGGKKPIALCGSAIFLPFLVGIFFISRKK